MFTLFLTFPFSCVITEKGVRGKLTIKPEESKMFFVGKFLNKGL